MYLFLLIINIIFHWIIEEILNGGSPVLTFEILYTLSYRKSNFFEGGCNDLLFVEIFRFEYFET